MRLGPQRRLSRVAYHEKSGSEAGSISMGGATWRRMRDRGDCRTMRIKLSGRVVGLAMWCGTGHNASFRLSVSRQSPCVRPWPGARRLMPSTLSARIAHSGAGTVAAFR